MRADELPGSLAADGVHLCRDRVALAPAQHEPDLAHDRRVGHQAGPGRLGIGHRLLGYDRGPRLPDELVGLPSGEIGQARREDREVARGIGLPNQVGRRDHQVAEARLGVGEVLDQLRVCDGDGGVVREALEQLELAVT